MAKYASMVKEITTDSGGGPLTIVGNNAPGFRAISDAFSIGEYMRYYLTASDGQWEEGFGKYENSISFTREFVTDSSNGGALINLPAGDHTITFGATPDCYITRGYHLYASINNTAPHAADHIVAFSGGVSAIWDSDGACAASGIFTLPVPNWVDRIRVTAGVLLNQNGSAGRRTLKLTDLTGNNQPGFPLDQIGVAQTAEQESLSIATLSLAVPTAGGRGCRIVLTQNSGSDVTVSRGFVFVEFVE